MVKKRIDNRRREWAAKVERACAASGLQLTELRRHVLDILAKAPAPLGAYAIIDRMSRAQQKPVGPPTVYRTLEFFLEHGFVHKIESRNAYAPCEHVGHSHNGILLVCERCGRTDEMENPDVDKLLRETAAQAKFVSQRHIVEVQGLCQSCEGSAPPIT
jgi:Fur family transcriptional regulator, zinc uptake regulator